MENIVPEQENNPSARIMSTQEMMECFSVLARLREDGEGDKTINDLYERIYLKLGKRSENPIDKSPADDDQESE